MIDGTGSGFVGDPSGQNGVLLSAPSTGSQIRLVVEAYSLPLAYNLFFFDGADNGAPPLGQLTGGLSDDQALPGNGGAGYSTGGGGGARAAGEEGVTVFHSTRGKLFVMQSADRSTRGNPAVFSLRFECECAADATDPSLDGCGEHGTCTEGQCRCDLPGYARVTGFNQYPLAVVSCVVKERHARALLRSSVPASMASCLPCLLTSVADLCG